MCVRVHAVGAELATVAFQCMLPAVIITLTGSRLLLLSALWNPEAVKQIEEWCISTFSQSLNLNIFSAWVIDCTTPAGPTVTRGNTTPILRIIQIVGFTVHFSRLKA